MNFETTLSDQFVLKEICRLLRTERSSVTGITSMKTGMTNNSFSFRCHGKKCIIRIPGAGTDQLISRSEEFAVYQVIRDYRISDDVLAFDPESGIKITAYIPAVHTCDPHSIEEIRLCMQKLRKFHEQKLFVDHEFRLFEKIEYYESLRSPHPSVYPDYDEIKEKMRTLYAFTEQCPKEHTLCHIDAVCDNFLVFDNHQAEPVLIDWEYAAMQDPHIDIAMFIVYSGLSQEMAEQVILAYFGQPCSREIRLKIYCYIALCGFLWSNWCEFKQVKGECFGDYAVQQYEFARRYYDLFCQETEVEAHV